MTTNFPPELLSLFESFESFEQGNRERKAAAAKANPLAHKLTRVFDAGVSANYRFWGYKNGKNQAVRFCYAVNRNAAGFYLGWREIFMRNGTCKRDMWIARRVRSRCADIAKARTEKARQRMGGAS